MNVDPQEISNDELKLALDQQMGDFSPEDMNKLVSSGPRQPPPEERGQMHGRVIAIRGDSVFVDVGGKSEAIVPLVEFDADAPPVEGQTRSFVIHGVDPATGQVRLSLREARTEADLSSLNVGDVVEGRVTGLNLGGLELMCLGTRAFLPKSQVELHRVEDFAPYVGRKLDCEITEIDRRGRHLVLSRRRLLERQREQARQELKYALAPGQSRKGVVRRLTDFGAFVDLGGIEGLLHISDMSYSRLGHPSEVLKEGQEIDIQVLKVDLVKDRVSLGLKQMSPDPWNLVEANYRPGQVVDGKITRLADFGAFVELQPGIEGLIPISEMSWTQRVRHPKDILGAGDSVRVTVLSVDAQNHKLSLSLKSMGEDPWKTAVERYKPGETVSGSVARLADFGAFILLEDGIEGLVHISEMSDKHVRTPGDVVKIGDVVQARIKSIDPAQRRVSLSLKAPATVGGETPGAGSVNSEPAKKKARKQALRGGLE